MDMFEEKDIYTEYPKETKPSKKKIVTLVVVFVLVLALVAGVAFFGGAMYAQSGTVESEMPMVKTVIDALNRYYIDEIDWEQFQFIVASAVANSIDPYTGLVAATPTGMKTASIGVTFGWNDYCNYYITEISPGSPAAKAKNVFSDGSYGSQQLKVGDEIYSINGQVVQHLNSSSFSQLLSVAGDTLDLRVLRHAADGSVSAMYQFKIDKEMFHAPVAYYLDSETTGLPSDVGYIKLNEFGDTAPEDFYNSVQEFLADEDKPNKLVLDLRGNGGGDTMMCGYIASFFVKQNGTADGIPMAKYVYNSGGGDMAETYFYTQTSYVSDLDGKTYGSVNLYDEVDDFECVILVNGSSASSSELLTATLSHYCGIKSVGSKTYGKGVAQIVLTYNNQKYEMYITNGKYYIPTDKNGNTVFETNIHGVGLTPDIAAEASGIYYMELDPCLTAAAEYFTSADVDAVA